MKHAVVFFLLVLFGGPCALGQHSSNAYRTLADSLYRHHHYQYAADYYEKALKKAEKPGYLMLQLGKCYDKVNKPLVAEQWFRMAAKKRAPFADEDYYLYAEALVAQQKYERADSLLSHILTINPDLTMAQRALDDLRNMDRFYADSALFRIKHMTFNSDVAEFSAVPVRDGIVFTSARQEGALKKKYHWDNSHFLNLYYAHKTDTGFTAAELFEKDLNTRHHDGPASFYNHFQKMIINRNQRIQADGREEVFEMRPGLYDATFNSRKSNWEVTPLPFNNAAYSFAHPAVSEDGNTLYFSSDMPGGFGGMDLYRVLRIDGVWGAPYNLGPVVNTLEDEVFPFFVNNTLYFSSTGHGGLGGLDVFISERGVNGFTPPKNAGYPINSFADDLSLTTDSLQRDGYFSSSRKGNDDIYAFHKLDPATLNLTDTPAVMHLAARVYRADDNQVIPNAEVRVMTFDREDQQLTSGTDGIVDFKLAQDQAYVIVATKDGLAGMHSGIAEAGQQRDSVIHPVPMYGEDPNAVLAMGLVTNKEGTPIDNFKATVTNKQTGESIKLQANRGLLTFLGDRAASYDVNVAHDDFQTQLAEVNIPSDAGDTHKFTVVMREKPNALPNAQPAVPLAAVAAVPTTLLFVDTEDGKSKAFISASDELSEVKEKQGELTVQQGQENKSLGKGTLQELRTDPEKILAKSGLSNVSPVLLRSVYFEFDQATLDKEATDRLGDVIKVLDHQPDYQLTISGHADDRGDEVYNERLSKRRANAVAKYLKSQGVDYERIIMKAYGEARPAIPCMSGNCSEDDHRLNRRAEFLLQSRGSSPAMNSTPDNKKNSVSAANTTKSPGVPSASLLSQCGDAVVDGVSFRVNIGAYRKKNNLTFSELAGIGTVESVTVKGVTYYFLTPYQTLAKAEQARQQAVLKGIADASISAFRNGTQIRLDDFAALAEEHLSEVQP